ncbi:MAG: DMT family transporter [Woeseiaceae bacterium]|nr:DMT family transporter [Woeseiaceae bacterium]
MPVPLLYAVVVLVWGSTWFAIKLQLGPVPEELSVAYRFALASLCLFAFARVRRQTLAIARADYLPVVLQGALMYSIAYVLVYFGSRYITTGLIAVLYSSIVILNGALERLFYGRPVDRRLGMAAFVGLCGTVLVFWPEVSALSLDDEALLGILWSLGSVLFAALGNMAAIRNTSRGIPVLLINAHGMAWGALLSFSVVLVLGKPLTFSLQPDYLVSLVYLSIFGSCIAFGAFIALLKQIGAGRASYVSVLFPIIALLISTVFEGYRWHPAAFAGVFLILAGNWLALSRVPERPDTPTPKPTVPLRG